MLTATRIRLYPTPEQQQKLAVQFGCARWVWNDALALTQQTYRETGKGLSYHALAVRLPKLKQEFEWLKDADSQVLQQSLQNLALAFDGFFGKRAKYPRFKSKHGRQSIQYPQRVKLDGNRIYLPKVGWVKGVVHREIVGKLKTVTVSRNACGQFHAAVLTDTGMPMPAVSTEGKAIGIDVGLLDLAVTSDGSKFANPRHITAAERNLKRKQRKLARKVKGSNSRAKARRLVARAHQRVADARRDHLHKLSRRIVNENQVVVVEDLTMKGMVKNPNLAKAISDAGWGTLTHFIEYKCERDGKAFIRTTVGSRPARRALRAGTFATRWPWRFGIDVLQCGASHDRDVNAAKNIRDEGIRLLASGTGASASRGTISRRKKLAASRAARPDEAGSPRL